MLIIYILLNLYNNSYCSDLILEQSETTGINSYLNEMDTYVSKEYNIDLKKIFNNLINGDLEKEKSNIFSKILDNFSSEFKDALSVIGKILIIVVISSLLTNLTNSFSNNSITSICFFIAYISIIIIVMNNFNDILEITKNTLKTENTFMYSTIPIMFTLITTTGSFVTANIFQPILMFLIQIINIFANNILLPIILIFTVLNIVSNITEKNQLGKLSKFLKSTTIWSLGLGLTILVGFMSLEGTLSGSIDGFTTKTTKAAVTNLVPVVGKILADSVDTVLGCTVILKNALGFLTVIVIILVCLAPILKIAILMGMYYFTAAIIDPISDVKITKAISSIADSLKLILAILISLISMYIISITLLIKISNFTLTYR